MNNENFEKYIERIAIALERIANAITEKNIIISDVNDETIDVNLEKNNYANNNIEENNSEVIENDNTSLIEFLNSKNITVKYIKPEDEADKILDNIALFMGDRYTQIKKIYDLIKRTMNTGGSFRLDMKNYQQDEISSITQLGHNLHQIAFLEEYKYLKSPKFLLFGKVNRIPKALNFFAGGWLERYIKTAIIESIRKYSVRFSYLKNPQIQLPNGDDFELDILFNIENEIFWFEAKTGEYQRYVQKYSNVAKILGLDYEHSYMILSDITESSAHALKSMFKMTVVRIDDFSKHIEEVFLEG